MEKSLSQLFWEWMDANWEASTPCEAARDIGHQVPNFGAAGLGEMGADSSLGSPQNVSDVVSVQNSFGDELIQERKE